jgi:D-tyrosyl-tRNA(Tyr) deacylase
MSKICDSVSNLGQGGAVISAGTRPLVIISQVAIWRDGQLGVTSERGANGFHGVGFDCEGRILRFVIQRVTHASVTVDGAVVGAIEQGLVVLVGVGQGDDESIARRMVDKLLDLRIFSDEAGKMNRSVADVGGGLLMISQFTLYADCRKGRRPSFIAAGPPGLAEPLFEFCIDRVKGSGLRTQSGIFAADMQVSLNNDGPVTIIIDSDEIGL